MNDFVDARRLEPMLRHVAASLVGQVAAVPLTAGLDRASVTSTDVMLPSILRPTASVISPPPATAVIWFACPPPWIAGAKWGRIPG